MEDATTATLDPAAEAEAAPPSAPEESSRPDPADDPAINAQMNALIRGNLGRVPAAQSKPDADEQDDADADATGGESAPTTTGDVKPSEQSAPGKGRRGSAARIAELEAETQRLQQALDAVQPKVPDASEEAKARILETEQRYRRLLVKPESDTDWTSEDIQFLEAEKQRRALAPELGQHYETVLEEDRKALVAWAEGEVANRWNAIKADLTTTLSLPGVTEAIKAELKAAPLSEQIRIHRRLERESVEPELKRLREEVASLKRDLLGATPAPLSGGRSSPGRTFDENTYMNTLLRGGRV